MLLGLEIDDVFLKENKNQRSKAQFGKKMENANIFNNNTHTINSNEPDFFEDLYSDSLLKQGTMAIFYTGVLFGLILESGIIWYERGGGNQRYRTAINQLFSTVSWIVVTFIFIVYLPFQRHNKHDDIVVNKIFTVCSNNM